MANENDVIVVPEEEVTIEQFGGDDGSSSAKDTAVGVAVIGGSFIGGLLFGWAIRKIKKAVNDAKTTAHLKRKEEESRIEEELKRRAEENNTDAEDFLDEDLDD